MKVHVFIRWIPAFVCMAVIFYFSSQTYHQQDLRPRLHEIIPVQQVVKHFSDVNLTYARENISIKHLGVAGFVEFFIRKAAHLSIYFLLGCSVAFAMRSRNITLFVLSLMFCILYAGSDEFHQSVTGDRTPLLADVFLDTIGAFLGIVLYTVVVALRQRFVLKQIEVK